MSKDTASHEEKRRERLARLREYQAVCAGLEPQMAALKQRLIQHEQELNRTVERLPNRLAWYWRRRLTSLRRQLVEMESKLTALKQAMQGLEDEVTNGNGQYYPSRVRVVRIPVDAL